MRIQILAGACVLTAGLVVGDVSAAPALRKAPAIRKAAGPAAPKSLALFPAGIHLQSRDDGQQLLVTGLFTTGEARDFTSTAIYRVSDARVATVTPSGVVTPVGDGTAVVIVTVGALTAKVPVATSGSRQEAQLSFKHDVQPILTRFGCNAGGCHGKATGQNGFRLSLFGFDPVFDYDAVVKDGRGRRVAPERPDESLILAKGTASTPHGGGRRFSRTGSAYRLIRRWIAQGMPFGQEGRPSVVRVTVTPTDRIMGRAESQQIAVTAELSDGATRDVTRDAVFRSNEESIATVDDQGKVLTGKEPGEAAVMASYMGQVAVFRAAIPMGAPGTAFKPYPASNYIDELVFKKLRRMGIPPSDLCTDGEFLRRASLDLCGRMPKPEEVRAFLADTDVHKREKLVDRLLDDPDYPTFFALKWSNILRNTGQYKAGAYAFHAWIREAIATNKPYDEFVRDIVAGQGEWEEHPPVSWYWQFRDGGVPELVGDVSELFMGVRMQCAKCHHHPYEKWSQDDYYGLAGFFTRMGRKILKEPAYYYSARKVTDGLVNPTSGKPALPKYPDGDLVTVKPGEDPRQKLVDWLAKPENPYFSTAIVNRLWAHFMGRGLVEPVDDLRVTNPPSNPELMQAMSHNLVEHHFDLKAFIRTVCTSRTYQLSSNPNKYNAADRQNYARYYPKRLLAEVLLDGVDHVTGTKTNWGGVSAQDRAISLPHEEFPSYFLDVFGRPKQLSSPCECARDAGANLSQVLHLMNDGELDSKIASGEGRASKLGKADRPLKDKVEDLFLAAFSRLPEEAELQKALDYVGTQKEPQKAFEELIWTFVNCREFQFNH